MKRICLISLVFCLLLAGTAVTLRAQGLSNMRFKTIVADFDTLRLDTLSIVPGTLHIRAGYNSDALPANMYQFDAARSELILLKGHTGDTLYIQYRVFPYFFAASKYHKDYAQKKASDIGILMNPFAYVPNETGMSQLNFGALDYNGSLSRGIVFGNNQDLALNSSLNLQMSGKITQDIEVLAALTDNNIPIQPDGNTQRLQEFDKIFIQLDLYKKHRITLGDFEMRSAPSHFMRYLRNMQGIKYSGGLDLGKSGALSFTAGGALAKGKFARNTLVVSEGNQGPYKLVGANGETFIIILAGSERVFINGVQMVRGADRDYVIDYNLGEIRFTPKRIITKDLRVNVEFNYSERNYLRSAFQVGVQYDYKKLSLGVNFYSEQDAKNQGTQQKLDALQKGVLSSVGDSLQYARYPGYKYEGYNADRILYRLTDTIAPDAVHYDSVFVYSVDPERAVYSLNFTQVGQGKGNYKLAVSGSNGRVYVWVPPIGGVKQGDYEPVQILVAPARQQMLTFNAAYRFNKKNIISGEFAYSNNDPNTFSKRDDAAHNGYAGFVNFENIIYLSKKDSSRGSIMKNTVNYEYLYHNFSYIERFRSLQFNRNWNLPAIPQKTDEHSLTAATDFTLKNLGALGYHLTFYDRPGYFKGFEHTVLASLRSHGVNFTTNSAMMHSYTTDLHTIFLRPVADLSYAMPFLKGWKVGAAIDHELNRIQHYNSDTLFGASHLWQVYKFYLASPDSMTGNRFGAEATIRYEQLPVGDKFNKPHFKAQTYTLYGDFLTKPKHQLSWNLTYRHVKQTDSLTTTEPEHFYLGRIEYRINELKGFFRSTLFYEIGSGREPKQEFSFVQAPNGYGQYAWKDLNGNGVKELNEYYISQFQDENRYIKVFNTTNQLVSVNSTNLNFMLTLTPANLLRNSKGIKKFISRFSTNSVVQVSKKIYSGRSTPFGQYFNPLPIGVKDSVLVSTNLNIRNSIYFNRSSAKWGVEFNSIINKNRSLLTNGFEERSQISQNVSARWNIYSTLSVNAKYNNGIKRNYSDFFPDRRYEIQFNETESELSYIWNQKIRVSTVYNYSFQSNPHPETGGQFMVQHLLSAEIKYNSLKQGIISGKFSFVNINYSDIRNKNSQVEFAMLQGLQKGANYLWNISFTRKISENVELTLSYDGRKTGTNSRLVHTGNAQVRALF